MITLSVDECAQRSKRRFALAEMIKKEYPAKHGVLLFCASYEKQREPFYQDSAFFYYVGLDEPGMIVYQAIDADPVVYEPDFMTARSIWTTEGANSLCLEHLGIANKRVLGKKIRGYSIDLFGSIDQYQNIIDLIKNDIAAGKSFFIPVGDSSDDVRFLIERLVGAIPGFKESIIDISALSGILRRKKDNQELEYMYKAIEITSIAHEAAASVIKPGKRESDVNAAINYIFTEGQSVPAFASIVGSGLNSTVLHYVSNDAVMQQGDVVVIDIGASYKHYCADISRTYPVSGVFTRRQKELYDIVLATQEYVAALAQPGMWLNNPECKEKSLHHLACDFLKQRNLDTYFPHGIGHFVGLDVHDVGNQKEPLKLGDIITIEPGVYIPQERLGIRIEDMYWIVDGDAICLTDGLPKTASDIEEAMRGSVLKEEEQWKTEKNEHLLSVLDLQA